MRFIFEHEREEEYLEIFLSDKEIENIKDGKLLVSCVKYRYRNKLLGICIRRQTDATQKGEKSE